MREIKSWWASLGFVVASWLVVQALTGFLLLVYFEPSAANAWSSVEKITLEIPAGGWIRSLHFWGAQLLVVLLVMHGVGILYSGVSDEQGRKSWISAFSLFLLLLSAAFTGFVLAWTQDGFWAGTVSTELLRSFPWIGNGLTALVQGGKEFGASSFSRFFLFHAWIIPVAITLVLLWHLKALKNACCLRSSILFTFALALGISLALLFPAAMGEKADPFQTPEEIRPLWFLLPGYKLLHWLPSGAALAVFILLPAILLSFPFWFPSKKAQSQ